MKSITEIIPKIKLPKEADPEQQRVANTLAIFLSSIIYFYPTYQLAAIFLKGESLQLTLISLTTIILVIPIYFASYFFYQKRQYTYASQLAIASLWLSITLSIMIRGTILMQIYSLFYILVLLAGYLLPQREAIFVIFLSYFTTLFLWWSEPYFSIDPHNYPPTTLSIVFLKWIMLSVIGVFIIKTTGHIRDTLASLQQANNEVKEREFQLATVNHSLLTQSNLLQTIIDNLPERITYMNTQRHVEFMSRGFSGIGIDINNPVGKQIIKTIDEEHIKLLTPPIHTIFLEDSVKWEKSFTNKNETKIIHTSYIPHFVNGEVKGVISLARDITEEQRAKEAGWQAQKLASLGVLAGGVAHDFNNLLTAILGHCSLATLKMQENHPAFNHISKIISASERASDLTQQMLAYSGAGHFLCG